MLHSAIFVIAIVVVAWLGLRNLITIIIGFSQTGQLKEGQRLCHFVSFLLYWGACGFAIYDHSLWPLAIGTVLEITLRKTIVRLGQEASKK